MSDTEHTPPKKKIRIRNCIFNENWRLDANYKNWLVREEKNTEAYCSLCKRTFTVQYDGVKAVEQHHKGKTHCQRLNELKTSAVVTKFFPTVDASNEKKIFAAEITKVFHNAKHGLSYLLADCGKFTIRFILTLYYQNIEE